MFSMSKSLNYTIMCYKLTNLIPSTLMSTLFKGNCYDIIHAVNSSREYSKSFIKLEKHVSRYYIACNVRNLVRYSVAFSDHICVCVRNSDVFSFMLIIVYNYNSSSLLVYFVVPYGLWLLRNSELIIIKKTNLIIEINILSAHTLA